MELMMVVLASMMCFPPGLLSFHTKQQYIFTNPRAVVLLHAAYISRILLLNEPC